MFETRLEKTDKIILLVAFCCFLISSALLLDNSWLLTIGSDIEKLDHIGDVEISQNDVRRRHNINFTWIPLKVGNNIYQGDSIYTGKNSSAKVITKNGEEIRVSANSLVVINSKSDGLSLDISFGSIKGRVDKGKKLRISSNNQITELTGSDALVVVDAGSGDNVMVNVVEGEVNLKTDKGTQLLKKNEIKTITPNDKITIDKEENIEFITPIANAKIRPGVNNEIDFVWKSEEQLKSAKIIIALDKNFKTIVHQSEVLKNRKQVSNLPLDQNLYWKITTKNSNSNVSNFLVVGSTPPVPIYPKVGEHLYFDKSLSSQPGLDVNLVWDSGSYSENYQIQISNDKFFEENVRSVSSKEKSIFTGRLQPGEYYWRVKGTDFPSLEWSETAYFNVGDSPMKKIAPPPSRLTSNRLLLFTKNNRISARKMFNLSPYKAQQYVSSFPTLKWAPIANAENYTIEISKSQNFQFPLISKVVTNSYFIWREANVGKYYWRIRANTPKYTISSVSEPRRFTVAISPPASNTKELFTEEVDSLSLLNKKPPPFPLKWNSTVFSKKYEVEFSVNSEFTSKLKFVTYKNNKQVAVANPGVYYWRVRSIGSNNLPISNFSEPYKVQFYRTYKPPKEAGSLLTLSPTNEQSIIAVGKGKNEINFKWTNPFKNSGYRIELASDSDFKNMIYTNLTESSSHTLSKNLETGFYYWRVRAENKVYSSAWSNSSQVFIANEKIPFDFKFSEELFYARLRARERQRELKEIALRSESLKRSPAAFTNTRLDTPTPLNPLTHYIIQSKFSKKITWKTLTKQPFDNFYKQVRKPPTFKWNKVKQAQRYVLEIAKDKNFEKTITKYPTTRHSFVWNKVMPGRFFWRIQAFNDMFSRSQYSPVTELLVETETPTALSPDTIFEITDLPPSHRLQPAPFKLQWTPVVFARAYEIELSDKITFEGSRKFTVEKTFHNFKVSKSGTYFWKVRPINKFGIGVGPYSRARAIEIAVAQRSPASVKELTGLFPNNNRTLVFVGKGIMNLAFSWLSPYQNQIGEYVIEMSKNQSFNNVFARFNANNTEAIIRRELPEGAIFWRIGYKINGKVQSWSDANKFNLKREKETYDFKNKL